MDFRDLVLPWAIVCEDVSETIEVLEALDSACYNLGSYEEDLLECYKSGGDIDRWFDEHDKFICPFLREGSGQSVAMYRRRESIPDEYNIYEFDEIMNGGEDIDILKFYA